MSEKSTNLYACSGLLTQHGSQASSEGLISNRNLHASTFTLNLNNAKRVVDVSPVLDNKKFMRSTNNHVCSKHTGIPGHYA